MQYALIKNGKVQELIPAVNPAFPAVPIEERYTAQFLRDVVEAPDDAVQGLSYDAETGTFGPPPEPVIDDSITTTPEELDAAYRSGVNDYE